MSELKAEVSQEYKTYEPVQQKQVGDELIAGYYGFPLTFTSPSISKAAFTLINDNYGKLITLALNGDTIAVGNRNDYYTLTWLPAVEVIRLDVNKVSAGHKTTVQLSGFHSTVITTTKSVVGEAMALTGEGGASGSKEMLFDSKTKVKADSFLVLSTPETGVTVEKVGEVMVITIAPSDKPTVISALATTKKKGSILGQKRGDVMNLNITSLNGAGNSPRSNNANVVVP